MLVLTEVGNQPLEPPVLVLKLLGLSQLTNAKPSIKLLPTVKRLLRTPSGGSSLLLSACFIALQFAPQNIDSSSWHAPSKSKLHYRKTPIKNGAASPSLHGLPE
jgi:hypothetical protein